MNPDLLNILANSNKDIDNQQLMDYISGKLSGPEKYEVEKWLSDHEFTNDAMEGLQQLNKSGKLQQYVDQLNKDLKGYLQQKKIKRDKRKLKNIQWVYLAIVLIITMAIIAYVIIEQLRSGK